MRMKPCRVGRRLDASCGPILCGRIGAGSAAAACAGSFGAWPLRRLRRRRFLAAGFLAGRLRGGGRRSGRRRRNGSRPRRLCGRCRGGPSRPRRQPPPAIAARAPALAASRPEAAPAPEFRQRLHLTALHAPFRFRLRLIFRFPFRRESMRRRHLRIGTGSPFLQSLRSRKSLTRVYHNRSLGR